MPHIYSFVSLSTLGGSILNWITRYMPSSTRSNPFRATPLPLRTSLLSLSQLYMVISYQIFLKLISVTKCKCLSSRKQNLLLTFISKARREKGWISIAAVSFWLYPPKEVPSQHWRDASRLSAMSVKAFFVSPSLRLAVPGVRSRDLQESQRPFRGSMRSNDFHDVGRTLFAFFIPLSQCVLEFSRCHMIHDSIID